ncbi:MAG: LysR family transcriptional regulator [Synergistaceae bacterium]|nr:LysR family transcriptional regulator [Synergistaceae bacterium]
MNTQHLKYAVEIERSGSITKAADRLYLNQPHLSRTIRELEETLGADIFRRTSKGMVPTKRGAEFLACAKNILSQIEKMESLFDGSESPRISFSMAAPRASYISYALTEFIKSLPQGVKVDVNYRETNSISAMEDVVDGTCNLGIVRCQSEYAGYFTGMFDEKNLIHKLIREFDYMILCSSSNPLAAEDVVDCSKLDRYVAITHGDSALPSAAPHVRPCAARSDSGGGEIAVYERGSQLELLSRVHSTYMWVSPMPEEVLEKFSLAQKKSNAPRNAHKDFLIHRSGYGLSGEDKAFIEKLGEAIRGTKIA